MRAGGVVQAVIPLFVARAVCAVLLPLVRTLGRRGWHRLGRVVAWFARPFFQRMVRARAGVLGGNEKRSAKRGVSDREARLNTMRNFWLGVHANAEREARQKQPLALRRRRNRSKAMAALRRRRELTRGWIGARAARAKLGQPAELPTMEEVQEAA